MERFKGIIALDIDGTVTVGRQALEQKVCNFLHDLMDEGWIIFFITGRTFTFASPIFAELQGKYFLAVQNGAALFEMPAVKCLKKHSLPKKEIHHFEPIFQQFNIGLLIESGQQNRDICYYRPQDFQGDERDYVSFRMSLSSDPWVSVKSFDEIPVHEFAVGKFFARESIALQIAERLQKIDNLSVIVIRDPFRPGYHLALIHGANTSKGQILEDFMMLHGFKLPVIAAGDDFNDVEMLEKSTIKIVMQNGPEKLHELADVLAPPASEQGIVLGLKKAIALLKNQGGYGRNNKN